MIDSRNNVFSLAKTSEHLPALLEKIFAAARPDAVYSKPVVSGNYTVITASEITSSGGFGSGGGFELATSPSIKEQPDEEGSQPEQSGGGGFGGGGMSVGRPVAIIIIGPDGVTVKPIFDITKIALAGISAWITLLAMLRKALKASKG
jgi:uncharacterized spore protein YtfJ